jgi:hypothetical protein
MLLSSLSYLQNGLFSSPHSALKDEQGLSLGTASTWFLLQLETG